MNAETTLAQIKQRTEELVKRGGDLRAEVSRLVSDASDKVSAATGGMRSLVKAVLDGAASGARAAVPAESEPVLRAVVDGIADGLSKSAQALRLTLEESTANGTRFAKEDLGKAADDFRDLGSSVMDLVSAVASAFGGHVKEQARTLAQHARQTVESALPPLESALHAAQQEPVKLGKETLNAGAGAVRQAAGVLFAELGRHLQKAGEKLRA